MSTTTEACAGIVKATGIHDKCPTQHMTDMQMLSQQSVHRQKHLPAEKKVPKEVEFIPVSGATYKGPTDLEVRFLWTERHTTKVTTRCSGDRFLNRGWNYKMDVLPGDTQTCSSRLL